MFKPTLCHRWRVRKCKNFFHYRISSGLNQLATMENNQLNDVLSKLSEYFEKARKLEGRVASDEDLKLSDTLRYYMRDSNAAKNLLYRRSRSLANYETANKNLEKARIKHKDIQTAENTQQASCDKFEKLSEKAKQELGDFKSRRIVHFRKNFVDLVELELKHHRAQLQLLKNTIASLKEC